MENEENGGTLTPTPEAEPKVETPTPDVEKETKTFTQDEINALIAERATRAEESGFKKALKEAGFETKEELKAYIETSKKELSNYKFIDACNENKLSVEKLDDVKDLLKGKGLLATPENIKMIADTHPEWARGKREPALSPRDIGTAPKIVPPTVDEEYEKGKEYFPSLRRR